jgi:hypothetical protein
MRGAAAGAGGFAAGAVASGCAGALNGLAAWPPPGRSAAEASGLLGAGASAARPSLSRASAAAPWSSGRRRVEAAARTSSAGTRASPSTKASRPVRSTVTAVALSTLA